MIDIIYLAWNRLEFTKASMAAMIANTDWTRVRRLVVYDDGSTDGTREYLRSVAYPGRAEFVFARIGGPVAITNHYLSNSPSEIFAKVDNDTMLPPRWLNECLKVMDECPGLDLLGIEAFNPVEPEARHRSFRAAAHIGGIGLMRRRAFRTLPHHHGPGGRFGFTQWQRDNAGVVKGWIDPSLPVFLLDKMATEPWADLSRQYIAQGWQRKWPQYADDCAALWNWWASAAA